jgi:hypothetical protein
MEQDHGNHRTLRWCVNVSSPATNVRTYEYLRHRKHDDFASHETPCGNSVRFSILLYCRNFESSFFVIALVVVEPI